MKTKKARKPKQKKKGINWCGRSDTKGATCYCDYHEYERWKLSRY